MCAWLLVPGLLLGLGGAWDARGVLDYLSYAYPCVLAEEREDYS